MNQKNMLTPGKVLKHYRERKGYSLEEISKATKIPIEQLKRIEKDNYGGKDSRVFYRGFVKNYADYLNLDTEKILAIYRRTTALQENEMIDEVKSEKKNVDKQKNIDKVNSSTVDKVERRLIREQTPDSDNKGAVLLSKIRKKVKGVTITPALIATVGVTLLILGVITYFIVQVYKFQQAPELIVNQPKEELNIEKDQVKVSGNVELPSVVEINGDIITVKPDGNFSQEVSLVDGVNTITVKAYKGNNEDKSSIVTRNVFYNKPQPVDKNKSEDQENNDGSDQEEIEEAKPVEHTVYIEATESVWTKLIVDGVQKIAWNIPEGETSEYKWTESLEISSGKPKSSTVFIDGEKVDFVTNSQGTGKVDCEVLDDGVSCLQEDNS